MTRPRPFKIHLRPWRYKKYQRQLEKASRQYLRKIVKRMERLVINTPGVRLLSEDIYEFPNREQVLKRWNRVKNKLKLKDPHRWEPTQIPGFDYYRDRMLSESDMEVYIKKMVKIKTAIYRELSEEVAKANKVEVVFNDWAIKSIENKTFQTVTTDITPTISKVLKRKLTNCIKRGCTIEETAHSIGVLNTNWRTIANTETMGALNVGAADKMKYEIENFGGQGFKGWQRSANPNERETHTTAAGQYGQGNEIPIDESFIVGGEPMSHPHDPNASPGNKINCGCIVIYIVR